MGDISEGPSVEKKPFFPKTIGGFPVVVVKYGVPCFKKGRFVVPDTEWFRLRKRHFLLKHSKFDCMCGDCYRYWFVGIDGQPFTTEVTKYAFNEYFSKGVEEFYDFLEPDLIKKLCRMTKTKAKRQGVIWAGRYVRQLTMLSMIDDMMHELSELFLDLERTKIIITTQKVRGYALFGTRHRLNGTIVMIKKKVCFFDGVQEGILCQGRITAPNQPVLVLKDLHVVMKSDGLAALAKTEEDS